MRLSSPMSTQRFGDGSAQFVASDVHADDRARTHPRCAKSSFPRRRVVPSDRSFSRPVRLPRAMHARLNESARQCSTRRCGPFDGDDAHKPHRAKLAVQIDREEREMAMCFVTSPAFDQVHLAKHCVAGPDVPDRNVPCRGLVPGVPSLHAAPRSISVAIRSGDASPDRKHWPGNRCMQTWQDKTLAACNDLRPHRPAHRYARELRHVASGAPLVCVRSTVQRLKTWRTVRGSHRPRRRSGRPCGLAVVVGHDEDLCFSHASPTSGGYFSTCTA
jgi:hypothetical protein